MKGLAQYLVIDMNLLGMDDLDKQDIKRIFKIADELISGKERLMLKEHATIALLFTEPSTRTRVSFEVAIAQLGGHAIYIDNKTSQLSRGESLSDTSRMLSQYCDFIAIRTLSHSALEEFAASASVPIINALTSREHPTQALADIYTIIKAKGDLKGLRIALVGDISQNTFNSLMIGASKMGAEIALIGPAGSRPDEHSYGLACTYGDAYVYNDIAEGLTEADVIYTDTFVSMGDEADAAIRRRKFAPYQINSKALSNAKDDAIVMHPLPAHRGEEITDEVIDGKHSMVWTQALNKLHLEKAIMLYISEQTESKY